MLTRSIALLCLLSSPLLAQAAPAQVGHCRALHSVGGFNVPASKVAAYENCLNPGRGRVAECREAHYIGPTTINWWHRADYEKCLLGLSN